MLLYVHNCTSKHQMCFPIFIVKLKNPYLRYTQLHIWVSQNLHVDASLLSASPASFEFYCTKHQEETSYIFHFLKSRYGTILRTYIDFQILSLYLHQHGLEIAWLDCMWWENKAEKRERKRRNVLYFFLAN